jgi:Flp pilus assembly pilin Flp
VSLSRLIGNQFEKKATLRSDPWHLFGQNCDHDYYFELPDEGERDTQSITRCLTAHHGDVRALQLGLSNWTKRVIDTWTSRCLVVQWEDLAANHEIWRIQKVGDSMLNNYFELWSSQEGQDIAEYAVMLAVILVLVIGTVRLIGGNANNAFSTVASSLQ